MDPSCYGTLQGGSGYPSKFRYSIRDFFFFPIARERTACSLIRDSLVSIAAHISETEPSQNIGSFVSLKCVTEIYTHCPHLRARSIALAIFTNDTDIVCMPNANGSKSRFDREGIHVLNLLTQHSKALDS